jgi:predicted methyltransferase
VTEFEIGTKPDLQPQGGADMVVTFRNTHNWLNGDTVVQTYEAMYEVLKSGGILGVVQHRGKPDMIGKEWSKKGYVPESEVIRMAEEAGFKFAGKSEINANSKDTKDYTDGVWTLPPVYRLKDQDRDKYTAIGESDRMTLKFTKP